MLFYVADAGSTSINTLNEPVLVKYQVAYGTTENSPITFMGFPSDSMELKTDSVGYIMDHTEVWWS